MSRRSVIVLRASKRGHPTMTDPSWLAAPTQRRSWVGVCVFASVSLYEHACMRACMMCLQYAHLCSPLPILSLSGVDRHDCISPCFSVLCELRVELVVSQIALHSVHPPQFGPSSRSLPSHRHCCHMLCNVRIVSSQHMAIPRKAFLGDIYAIIIFYPG